LAKSQNRKIMNNYNPEKDIDALSERILGIERLSNERLIRLEDALKKMNDAIKRLESAMSQKNLDFRINLKTENNKGTISENLKNVGDIYKSQIKKNK